LLLTISRKLSPRAASFMFWHPPELYSLHV
jgi:hypothetical protein